MKENEYDDDDEDEDDYDDDDDDEDEDPLTDEQRLEESKKIFQMFAAKLFEQRVISAYREKGNQRERVCVYERQNMCCLWKRREKTLLGVELLNELITFVLI